METNKIKISSIVENQLPIFIREEYPLISELLTEYYKSLESKGSSYDILQNIDNYVNVNNLTNLIETTHLTSNIGFSDSTINVNSTDGFPHTYGLIQIENEIILYKSKTLTSFNECVRGFSGVVNYSESEDFTFNSSEIEEHFKEKLIDSEVIKTEVKNISSLFLKEFFNKVKKQFLYGFENRELYSGINQNLFLKQSKDFYNSKGTDRSFEILFRVLYGKDVEIILPKKYLIEPSNAIYRVSRNFVVEPLEGDINNLYNKTIFQDEYGSISKSFGTVTNIQQSLENGKQYYTLILDYDYDKDISVSGSIFGSLKIHPKTIISSDVSISSDNIIVDSTIGFPKSGELVVQSGNNQIIITYKEKTVNQFLNCSGITEKIESGESIALNTYAYGYDSSGNKIKFRITGVINDIKMPPNSFYYESGDNINLLSLGYNKDNVQDNNWIFNKSIRCEVKSFNLYKTNEKTYVYSVETYDDTGIYPGDEVEIECLIDPGSELDRKKIILKTDTEISTNSNKKFLVEVDFKIKKIIYVKKLLTKFSNKYTSDVTNVYRDFRANSLYVTSPSLPSYNSKSESEKVKDYKIVFSGEFSGTTLNLGVNHGFLTGDSVTYSYENTNNTLGIQSGIYFVKKESEKEIKLSRSRSNILSEKFVSIATTTVTNNIIGLTEFAKNDNIYQNIDSQRLIKKLNPPENTGKKYETENGTIGILANGVEILNYKSDDYVHYGKIKNIDVISSGNNYDIINPPEVEIYPESTGLAGANAYCWVEGFLDRIDIIDGGFNYIEDPTITISGGGGKGATALVKTISVEHSVNLNPTISNSRINLSSNIIGFSTYHKFRDGEEVIYSSGNNTPIGGLVTGAKYYVRVIDSFNINLHNVFTDSIVGINTVNLSSYGVGNQKFTSVELKRKINSIVVKDPGSGYKSKKIAVSAAGINTSSNTISVYDNPYDSGDVIYYYGGEENIDGLDVGKYIVTKVDDKSFKLSGIGTGSTPSNFYYKTNQYVDFKSTGSGNHIFDYEPIVVDIFGKVGISSEFEFDITAKVQPIFRGKIVSAFVYNGGVGYGCSTIINYNKQPNYRLKAGYDAVVTPIVSEGKIKSVVVNDAGKEYNSTPDLIVRGFGSGAILAPIIQNGELVEVKVINGGFGYEQKNTKIDVFTPGSGAEFKFNPQVWTINRFQRLEKTSKLSANDGVIFSGKNKEYGLQYTHVYPPRPLREKVLSQKIEDGELRYKSDYDNDYTDNKYHSPLLGWAYDGNPIYGPYGYDSPSNKKVRQIRSGYILNTNIENRPDVNLFNEGYFVEDYFFENSGDLDEHNGRYCVTPEFPNGVYAYFMTLDQEIQTEKGTFYGRKKPIFPYIIGNYYKSKPIDFNFDSIINQTNFDFENSYLVRNTNAYNTLTNNSIYEYFNYPKKLKSKIKSTYSGNINSIKIIKEGNNYQVGDKIIFDNSNSGGSSAAAEVSLIKGKNIVGISYTSITIPDIEFYPTQSRNQLIGFSTIPHNLNNRDIVNIDSLSTYDKNLQGSFVVGIRTDRFLLTKDVSDTTTTGIVTYFHVSGILDYPFIRENDILSINSEKIKVLNIDKLSSRIRVLREQESTVGTSHSAYSTIEENPRKFFIELENIADTQKYKLNKEIYFDPSESLGIGTIIGVGHTIIFSNPVAGITSIKIPEKTIYLRNHNLNTGDELLYKTNGGSGIIVSEDGLSEFTLNDNSIIYVAKISNDLIGISTTKVTLDLNGEYVGISQTASTLFFTSFGSGEYHSFSSKFENNSKGNVSKNIITLSTEDTHLLQKDDTVFLEVLSKTTKNIIVRYNDYHSKLVVNPRDFSSIDTVDNLITIENHGYRNGQKLIHTSSSPAIGLDNNGVYYAIIYDQNRIRLAKSYYDATNYLPIDIFTSSFGTLSQINPKIDVVKNQKVLIDLSDSSLSQKLSGSGTDSLFDFDLFTDENFSNNYFPVKSDGTQKILKFGNIGESNSKIEFTVDDQFPKFIWYNLIKRRNKECIIDVEVDKNNVIEFVDSKLNGQRIVTGVTSNTFSFNNQFNFDGESYSVNQATISYYTNSKNEVGKIKDIRVISVGRNYKKLPSISSINSKNGSGAILIPQSDNIGRIASIDIGDIGYNYSQDPTINPNIKFPTILRIEPLSSIEKIEVIFAGSNYNTSPDLIVLDGSTNEIVSDILLNYDIESKSVKIIKNTKGLYNSEPKIVPINNSNGIGISSVSYDNISKNVRVYLTKEFSDINTFPFNTGENVLIEGISVVEKDGKGYNSKNYNYSLFTIVNTQVSLSGAGAYIDYSLTDYIKDSNSPGTFDPSRSFGQIILEKDLPKFKTTLTKNVYIPGELITNAEESEKYGNVLRFDSKNEFLVVDTIDQFLTNSLVIGETSKSQAFIREIFSNESFASIDSSSIVNNGWNTETGFLNNDLQRVQDSDYYQYFSYAVKSEVPITEWNDVVSNLNHTIGFKKFSDLVVNSSPSVSGINTLQNEGIFSAVSELNSMVDVDCIQDFDLVTENNFYVDNTLSSNEIIFNSVILQDYSESIGNRVLVIDDISDEFNTSVTRTFVTSFNI